MYTYTYNKNHCAVSDFINDPASLYRKNTGTGSYQIMSSQLYTQGQHVGGLQTSMVGVVYSTNINKCYRSELCFSESC